MLWLLLALAAAAAGGLYSARRFLPSRRQAAVFYALFLPVLLLVFWALLQPGKRDVVTELIKPYFLVALDTSQSMSIAPDKDVSNRWETARSALAMPWTRIVDAECRIDVLPFDAQVGQVTDLNGAGQLRPAGAATMLRGSLREIAERYAGLNVAGLLLMSDGLDTREASGDWAREERPFPLYTVRLEAETKWELPPDLRIDAVTTPQRVTRNWTTELKALLYGQGANAQTVTVRLFKDNVLGEELPARFSAEGGQRELVFTLQHPDPGVFTYRVFLPPLPGEANTNDNEYLVTVHVAEDKNRLLYVEGVPRWEYRFLRRALLASPNVSAAMFYTGPDGKPRSGNAVGNVTANMTESDLAHFKVVVLGNLDAGELTEARALNLVRFVETGGSVILLGGNKAWGENGLSKTSLRKIMPVTAHGTKPAEAALSGPPFAVRLTDSARAHPAFAGDEAYWASLPGVLSVFPDVVPSLGAEVLAEANTPRGAQAMVLSHRYGKGKVAAIFTDSLWRWQLSATADRDQPYQRFWTQLTAWMLPEDDAAETRRIYLFAGRDRLFLGEGMEISARVSGSGEKPAGPVEATISFPDGREVPYTMSSRQIVAPAGETFDGYALDFEPPVPGHYTAVAAAGGGTQKIKSDPISFFVRHHSQETVPRPIDAEILKTLAAAGGGRFFETLDRMNEELSTMKTAAIQEEQSRFYSLWQRWPLILLLMALLSGAWALRKSRNMP